MSGIVLIAEDTGAEQNRSKNPCPHGDDSLLFLYSIVLDKQTG